MALRGTREPTNRSTDFPCPWTGIHRQEDALNKTPGLAGIVTPPHPMPVRRRLRGAG
jgi:hypothetical protein